jgi:flagellar hook capping protein FlgD
MGGVATLLLPATSFAETYRSTLRCNSGFTGVRIISVSFWCSEQPCAAVLACHDGTQLCPGLVSVYSPTNYSCASVLDPDAIRNFVVGECNYFTGCRHDDISTTCKRWAEIMYECTISPGVFKTVCMRVPGSVSLTCTPSAAEKTAEGDEEVATLTLQEVLPEATVQSPCLPPPGTFATSGFASYAGGVMLSDLRLQNLAPCVAPPPPGPAVTSPANGTLSGTVWLNNSRFPFNSPVICSIRTQFGSAGGGQQFFETEMLTLDLAGAPLPGNIRIRESPIQESWGWTTERSESGALLISSYHDVYIDISRDGGVSWQPANDGAGNPESVRLRLNGSYQPSDIEAIAPKSTALYPCVPNPFNPTTTIEFDLAHEGLVQLRILDVMGRVLRTLAQGSKPAGRHVLSWNGTDDQGNRLPSGVYVYQLTTSGYRAAKKMVLVK